MFNVFMRKFDLPLRNTLRPHKINGTDEAHQTVQSVEGDIVTSFFIIMDSMEKFGWEGSAEPHRSSRRKVVPGHRLPMAIIAGAQLAGAAACRLSARFCLRATDKMCARCSKRTEIGCASRAVRITLPRRPLTP